MEIQNAKIYFSQAPKEIQGGYKILLDLEDRIVNKGQANTVIDQVKQRLYQHRNLCEDFFSIHLLEPLYVSINASLELNESITQEQAESKGQSYLYDELVQHIALQRPSRTSSRRRLRKMATSRMMPPMSGRS